MLSRKNDQLGSLILLFFLLAGSFCIGFHANEKIERNFEKERVSCYIFQFVKKMIALCGKKWGLCEYVIVHTILGSSPVILLISLGGKPKWLQFGYHDVMRTSPIGQLCKGKSPPPPPPKKKKQLRTILFACFLYKSVTDISSEHSLRSCTQVRRNVRGEQRAHQNGKAERREVGKKTFLRPFLKRKEVRIGFESPSSFEGPETSCSARVRMVFPRPSAAMSIIEKDHFQVQCIHLLHQNIAIK